MFYLYNQETGSVVGRGSIDAMLDAKALLGNLDDLQIFEGEVSEVNPMDEIVTLIAADMRVKGISKVEYFKEIIRRLDEV